MSIVGKKKKGHGPASEKLIKLILNRVFRVAVGENRVQETSAHFEVGGEGSGS